MDQAAVVISESILVVDDESMLVRFIEKSLGRLGYKVTASQDSREALEIFRSNPESFDVIITDLNMPDIDGEDFVREALRTRADIPVILATGYSDTMTEEAAASLGVSKMILKPYTTRLLAEAVREALANGDPARP